MNVLLGGESESYCAPNLCAFIFPENNRRHQAMVLLENCSEETLAMILRQLTKSAKTTAKKK